MRASSTHPFMHTIYPTPYGTVADAATLTPAERLLFTPQPHARPVSRLMQRRRWFGTFGVLLVGDSHVAGLTDPAAGYAAARDALAPFDTLAAGVGGECTGHLWHRVARGAFDHVYADTLVVALGSNMLASWYRPGVVALSIAAVAHTIGTRVGASRVLLAAPFPTPAATPAQERMRQQLAQQLASYGDTLPAASSPFAPWWAPSWRDTDGPTYAVDGRHLTPAGYGRWTRDLAAALRASGVDEAPAPRLHGPSPLFWRAVHAVARARATWRAPDLGDDPAWLAAHGPPRELPNPMTTQEAMTHAD